MTGTAWNAPESDVLASVGEVLDAGERGVLATVVEVEGNAYRRPGAKMLVREDGEGVGHVTAGCLEDEVQALAREVLAENEPRVETYDLRGEEGVWGLGVGCDGVLTLLLEPVEESHRRIVDAHERGKDVGVLTVIDAEDDGLIGARTVYESESDALSGDGEFPGGVAERVRDVAADLAAKGSADTIEVDGFTVFVDGVAAPDDLVVVGAGHDVEPIVDLGSKAGFRVTVVGYRGASADPERFPAAEDVCSTSPARIRDAVDLDPDTYVVVATHNFVDDRITVDELLGETDVPYVGLMGPHERFAEMREAFEAEGRTLSAAELDRLYTPVGLDLGEGTPHGIALSVVAEVLAVRNGREPHHLRDREGHIHDRVERARGSE